MSRSTSGLFKQASPASPDSPDPPPLATAEFRQMGAPPEEELLLDSRFDKGEAVGYNELDESLRLDASDTGKPC